MRPNPSLQGTLRIKPFVRPAWTSRTRWRDHMNQQVSDLEATSLLKSETRTRQAEAVLERTSTPNRWIMGLLCGSAAGVGSYALQGANLPHEVKGLIVGLLVGVAALMLENWSMKRRLEAAIQLLRVLQAQQSKG